MDTHGISHHIAPHLFGWTKHHRWWFQPTWKIFVKLDYFPNFRGWQFQRNFELPPPSHWIHLAIIFVFQSLWVEQLTDKTLKPYPATNTYQHQRFMTRFRCFTTCFSSLQIRFIGSTQVLDPKKCIQQYGYQIIILSYHYTKRIPKKRSEWPGSKFWRITWVVAKKSAHQCTNIEGCLPR